MRIMILGIFCLSLISCKGAENFFDPLPSFLISGKFTVESNQYIDDDTPSDSGNNSLASPQDIAAPANVAGYASSSNDAQDCYDITGAGDQDDVKIKAASGITASSIKLYSGTTFEEEFELGSENALTTELDGANRVCFEVTAGADLYALTIEGGTASVTNNLGNMTALLVEKDDNDVRSDASVPATSNNQYDYALNGTENNAYRVVMGTDLDEDDVYCEIGEICGDLNLSGTLTADLSNQDLNADFEVCFSSVDCESVTNN